MKYRRLDEMIKGWFVGDFDPSVLRTTTCEVAVKHYSAGDFEELHHHRIATELTLVVSGEVQMLGQKWSAGDIVLLEPNEATDFSALTDATCAVVKIPSVSGDKYPGRFAPSG